MLITLVVFLLILSILVLVHELGHFFVAKKTGIRVEEFGFGLPPRIFGIKKGETIYSINLLPFGGFVKLFGEDEEESLIDKVNQDYSSAFFAKSKLVRALVLIAGVAMNFFLAILVISFIFTYGVEVPSNKVFIKEVLPDSPAQTAGILPGDQVISAAEQKITAPQEFVEITKKFAGKEMVIEIFRPLNNPCLKPEKVLGAWPGLKISCKDKNLIVSVIPRVSPPAGEGPLGVAISNLEERKYPWFKAPFLGTVEAIRLSGLMVKELGKIIFRLITFKPIETEVAGPLGIAQVTGQAVKFGPIAILQLLGLLSLNLAVINILPFPALDGGRLLFIGIEAVWGKKVRPKWEKWTHQVGMAILLSLIILVTINDLMRILKIK